MLLDFLDEAKIERAGCFKYEPVKGAASRMILACRFVPEDVKEARFKRFMERQQKISADILRKRKVGKRLPVIIDQSNGLTAKGRSKYDAPEIDGNVHVIQARRPDPGWRHCDRQDRRHPMPMTCMARLPDPPNMVTKSV